jgi:hypothetical protein
MTVDVDLGHLVEIVFAMSLKCKVTLSLAFHTVLLWQSLCVAHT